MGKVTAHIVVENLLDVLKVQQGELGKDRVRTVNVEDALVDTGATFLCLPAATISKLGLVAFATRTAITANGKVRRKIYKGAQLTILGRTCSVDVMELRNGVSALVGYLPLESLDLVPDPKQQKLIPNPAHGGKWVVDLY